jgi:dUTP pyrophosphatase
MFVYLARPIDQAGEASWLGSFIADLNALMVQAQIGAFKPDEAYLANTSSPEHAERIDSINNTAIYLCDAFIAVLPAGVATLGVPVEIGLALQMNKPTVIFTDITYSVQLAAWSRKGAQIVDVDRLDNIGAEEPFTPETLRKMLTTRPQPDDTLAFGPQVPTAYSSTIELVAPGPLLVAGAAANLRPGQYPGDAGIDLALSEEVTLYSGQYSMVGTGVHVAIPEGYFGWITGRSSTWRNHRVDVRTAVIDSGYRGELMVGLDNRSDISVTFGQGQRLAQLVLLPAWSGAVEAVDDLPPHDRGHNGYGSSGH